MDLILVEPRGFCAGVVRAIAMLDAAIERFGSPIYVVHEIVHNKSIIDNFKKKGVIFVDHINDIPQSANVVLSAHGSALSVLKMAEDRGLNIINAVCPLVSVVHDMVKNFDQHGVETILIGHADHVEVIGTKGQVEEGVLVICTEEEARNIKVKNPEKVGYVTQTTLNSNDIQGIIAILKERFPSIRGLRKSNVCYATQNRQEALKKAVGKVDVLLVIGSANSSNGNRLKEIGQTLGKTSYMIDSVDDLRKDWFFGVEKVAITAAASAPEYLVQGVVDWLSSEYSVNIIIEKHLQEEVYFSLPENLR